MWSTLLLINSMDCCLVVCKFLFCNSFAVNLLGVNVIYEASSAMLSNDDSPVTRSGYGHFY